MFYQIFYYIKKNNNSKQKSFFFKVWVLNGLKLQPELNTKLIFVKTQNPKTNIIRKTRIFVSIQCKTRDSS